MLGELGDSQVSSSQKSEDHEHQGPRSSCERCGAFLCDGCVKLLFDRKVCASCDWTYGRQGILEMRDRFWGRPGEWVCGCGGVGVLLSLLLLVFSIQRIAESSLSASDFIGIFFSLAVAFSGLWISFSYFFLRSWARKAVFLWPLFAVALLQAAEMPLFTTSSEGVTVLIVYFFIPMIVLFQSHHSPRTKLAFKIELSEKELEDYYSKTVLHPLSYHSFSLSFMGFFLPPLLLLSLLGSVIGILKYDPKAWPPIRGLPHALAGLFVSLFSLYFWAVVINAIYQAL